MDSPPQLSGETLIVHHIPLVHCQVSGGRQGGCGASLKRSNPFSQPENLGLSRTTSLPERDVLQREALLYSSLIQTPGGGGGGRGGSTASEEDSSYSSSTSEDQQQQQQQLSAHTLPRAKARRRGNPLRRNPFLLNTQDHPEDEEEEEYEEEEGDNLNGYHEDSSFHLHGDANPALDDNQVSSFRLHEPFLLHGTLGNKGWGSVGGVSGSRESLRGVASDLDDLDPLGFDGPRRHGSSGSNMSMDCGEQEWGEDEEEGEEEEEEDHPVERRRGRERGPAAPPRCDCCGLSQSYQPAYQEPFSDCPLTYGSDSSCNSSDGVLVNFSAIFNKMNNGVPDRGPPPAGPPNLNASSCTSSVPPPGGGPFYLDLHASPTEPAPQPQQRSLCPGSATSDAPLLQDPHVSSSSTCSCSAEHQGALELDANCNSYRPPLHSASSGDITSCLQSQARLVVATQNYYKLVTCDLSVASSPSPGGSSATSCSEEPAKTSPSPAPEHTPDHAQPREYYLFRPHPQEGEGEDEDEEERREEEEKEEEEEEEKEEEEDGAFKEEEEGRKRRKQSSVGGAEASAVIQGQVYVNTSPPSTGRAAAGPRPRSRSYDRILDKTPPPQLGLLERMLSCPVRLSEGAAPSPPPPPRVTSFAEIARSKRWGGAGGASPSLRLETFSSGEFSPIPEQRGLGPLTHCYSQGTADSPPPGGSRETRTRAEGLMSSPSGGGPSAVVRYSKDQRPTTLPIQPFTFPHQFPPRPPQPKIPLLTGYLPGMQGKARACYGAGAPEAGDGEDEAQDGHHFLGRTSVAAGPPPCSVRPSPLGSYSPVRLQGAPASSGTCSTCTPSPAQPPSSPPAPQSRVTPLPATPPPPSLGLKRGALLPPVQGAPCCHRGAVQSNPPSEGLSPMDSGETSQGPRTHHAHHLSPQALKWREYRRRNPLSVDRVSSCSSSSGSLGGSVLDARRPGGTRTTRRNVFDFPPSSQTLGRLHGQSVKQLQQYYSDFLPDYFSLTERPPDEFCLSPDASSSSSSSSSSASHVSVDLSQKRGLVKAINTAVDLIVAHFGTSRDPDVKAKLGNSWVSPNVGHLILKYLCPALAGVLKDGLKAYVLDLIVGQRRCQPWSLVEASTQLGPSTRVLHSLYSKVSQYSELTNHSMRLNAFVFGLLNLKSLEFWLNHLYTHEDIVASHYQPWGLLPLSQGACQPLFEELLLLLQPLSLLPFDLDLLFEPRLLQKGEEHLRRKEQLCSAGHGVDQSTRSTFQLMRGWSSGVGGSMREGAESRTEAKREKAGLRREGTWPTMDGAGSKREGAGQRLGLAREGAELNSVGAGLDSTRPSLEVGLENLWKERGMSRQRAKGVGGEREDSSREKEKRKEPEKDGEEGRQRQDRQAGWWYQLMQSSQVYIDQSAQGSKFVKSERRRRSSERRQNQLPPTREGVVEGAESSQEGEGLRNRKWMGSPPESVLNQGKEPAKAPGASAAQDAPQDEALSLGHGMRWGRLFGSGVGSPSRTDRADPRAARAHRSRPPSGWLGLDRSVLDLVAQTIGAGPSKTTESLATSSQNQATPSPQTATATEPKRPSPCEARALCHHIATETGQLSFHKGEALRVVRRTEDPDWLLCSLGGQQGLVPLICVSLRGPEGPPPLGPETH